MRLVADTNSVISGLLWNGLPAQLIDAAQMPEDMNLPGYRFHGLKGKEKGRYAVDASGNWRITFAWDGRNAIDVDLEDYH